MGGEAETWCVSAGAGEAQGDPIHSHQSVQGHAKGQSQALLCGAQEWDQR